MPALHPSSTVAVVIPAKDEQDRIAATVRAVAGLDVVDVVVVVDDGSTDLTSKVARDAGAVVVAHHRNRGKAAPCRPARAPSPTGNAPGPGRGCGRGRCCSSTPTSPTAPSRPRP